MFQVTIPVLLGAIFIALMNVVRRFALKDNLFTALQFSLMAYTTVTIVFAGLYASTWGIALPATLLPGFLRVVLLGGAVNVVIQILNARVATYPKGEVSYALPLQSMTPLLITFAALVVGEFPGPRGALGVLTMMAGSYVLTFEKVPDRWWQYLIPFRRVLLLFNMRHLSEEERQKTIVTVMALTSAALGTIGLLCDGLMVRRGVTLQGAILACMMLAGILALSYGVWYLLVPDTTLAQRDLVAKSPIVKNVRGFALATALAFAAGWVMHVYLIQPHFDEAYIAYVGTLKRFSVIFAVLAGMFFFGEGSFKKRFFAAVLVVIGATLISFDSLPAHLSAAIERTGF